MKKMKTQVYQFKISLKGIAPKIWRRIQVPATYSFWDLSVAIQNAMAWGGHHLHEFRIMNPRSGVEEEIGIPDEDDAPHVRKGWTTKISRNFTLENNKAIYIYDFGDYWEHIVELEKILPADPGMTYPCCIAGKRRAPPDDVGSVTGYEEFVAIMKDPDHEEYEEMVAWYGDVYDPDDFDCTEVCFMDPGEMLRLMQE
jgi:hypothetical protein